MTGIFQGSDMSIRISGFVCTINNAALIGRVLGSLEFCDEIVVVDSGSTDETVAIAEKCGARVIRHEWEGFSGQFNFATAQCRNEWVLQIDSDEVVTPELRQNIVAKLENYDNSWSAACVARKVFYLGRWITHGDWYPNWTAKLFKKSDGRFAGQPPHCQFVANGKTIRIPGDLLHYTYRDINDQIETGLRYTDESAAAKHARGKKFSLVDLVGRPLWKFVKMYLLKRGFLDGLPGFVIACNSAHYVFLKYAKLYEIENRTSDDFNRERE